MNANKPLRERLLNMRLETIRLAEAARARASFAMIDRQIEGARAEKTLAKQARAARVRNSEKTQKLEKVGFENYRDDFLRSAVHEAKSAAERAFILRSDRKLHAKLQGSADRLNERDAAARAMLEKEEVLRASLIRSCL